MVVTLHSISLKVEYSVKLTVRDRRFLQEAARVVEEHLSEREFDVARLAGYIGKSRVTVHRLLRRILDQSASEFIRDTRLNHSTKLLDAGEFNVHQAAMQSGFYNQSYFSKCFKEKFGCLPSEFPERRSWNKEH